MKRLLYIIIPLFLVSCNVDVPTEFTLAESAPHIYPDYNQITIPYNIAPLNFVIEEEGEAYISNIYSENGNPITIQGKTVDIDLKKWGNILSENKGNELCIDVFIKKDGEWTKYQTIRNIIAKEDIDAYIAYRLIPPGYVIYKDVSIVQRSLSSFDEKIIYSNALMQTKEEGQCINCHSFQNYNKTHHFQLHVRGKSGGTLIENDGHFVKVNLKTDSTISAGVYPSWHPSENLLAYSVNTIGQKFHTRDLQKIEVFDKKSDIIVYDVNKNEIKKILHSPNSLETFPYWSPTGDALLYASADYKPSFKDLDYDFGVNYQKLHYNLIRIAYDVKSGTFGKTDTLFNAAKIGKSATFPRLSPNGKYLLFTLAEFGNFHIWHKSSDLYLLDMADKSVRNVKEINSPDVESYHSWSSNGKWIIFSSRRDDGSYTRFYLSYFNEDGTFSKQFILPQKDPFFYKEFFKSFNIPEFMVSPVDFCAHDLPKFIRKEAIQADFKE